MCAERDPGESADAEVERAPVPAATPRLVAIAAVTASGRDIASLEQLLPRLPLDSGLAVILVLQHREGLDRARLERALAPAGHTLTPVADGTPLVPGRIYLPEPGQVVTLENRTLRVVPGDTRPTQRGVIDSLLVSLATEDGHAIVIALASTDGDGTLGVRAMKEFGGLTLAEETPESRAGGLATSDQPAALADAVLPVDQLPARVAALVARIARQAPTTLAGAPAATEALAAIATQLRNRTGHDFHGYKPGTFLRRVQRRMQVLDIPSLADYVELLRTRAEEAQNLFNDLLIGVTEFFRDASEFDLLQREVIPRLFLGKTRDDALRVWVIGCSTGEEVYSIAILLREEMARLDEVPLQVQIFATDLDGRALAAARTGRYPETIAASLTPERLARWFVKEGRTYCVVKELREMCIFSQHSIIKDAPFSRLDLVSCRNLLIYLEPALQARVIPLFHFALRSGGYLFLGNSENVSRHPTLFAPLEARSRIFRRLDTPGRALPDFPFTAADRRPPALPPAPRPNGTGTDGIELVRRAERVAERFAPAYMIVDDSLSVLHFSGRTGRFIDPAGGAASLNLMQLVHPDLRADLRNALTRAAAEGQTMELHGLPMAIGSHRLAVDLVVEPLRDRAEARPGYVVLFREAGTAAGESAAGHISVAGHAERIQALEAELRTTRDRLQATIEELESTNEELKSSNEEYQSLNEELQSANEELETSKEELQSVNEELTTVNSELHHRVQELGRANSDLKNFLESTQIATVFLDNDLRVTNFTPAIVDVFHMVESDIGRPIAHIKPRIAYETLQDDARRVLRTLAAAERELADAGDQRHFIARMLPYRSTNNFIAGVVLTFVDITARRHTEEQLRRAQERQAFLLALNDALRALSDPAAILGEASRMLAEHLNTDRAYYVAIDEAAGIARVEQDFVRGSAASLAGEHRIADFAWSVTILRRGECHVVENTQTSILVPPVDRPVCAALGIIACMGAPLIKQDRLVGALWVTASQPRTWSDDEVALLREIAERIWATAERTRAEAASREAQERLRAFVEGMPQLIWRAAAGGSWTWAGPQWCDYTGLSEQQSLGFGWLEAVHPQDRDAVRTAWATADADSLLHLDCRFLNRASHRYHWFQTRAMPVRNSQGEVAEWAGTCTDIDDQVRTREALAHSAEELEQRVSERTAELMAAEETLRQSQKMEAIGQLTGGIAHDFNNMLQGVSGGIELARRRIDENRSQDALRYLDAVRDAADRAAALTRRLLAFARKQPLAPQRLDPAAVVRDMGEMISRSIGPAITLAFDLADSGGSIVCDRSELEGAVLNLCINARDAMPQGGRLQVAMRNLTLSAADLVGQEGAAPGPFIELRVQDTGTGMGPELLERVLEPFFTTKPAGEGTGLGLSQVYAFVRQAGGALRIASTVGEGTAVHLFLPCEPIPAPAPGTESSGAASTIPAPGTRILLVDDETHVRVPAAEQLRDLGYEVTEAADAPAALRLIEAGPPPHLLLTDVGLPGTTNGVQLAEAILAIHPGLPILFMTGYAAGGVPPWAKVIPKPFALATLTTQVAAALAPAARK